jgi:hypothetical protein
MQLSKPTDGSDPRTQEVTEIRSNTYKRKVKGNSSPWPIFYLSTSSCMQSSNLPSIKRHREATLFFPCSFARVASFSIPSASPGEEYRNNKPLKSLAWRRRSGSKRSNDFNREPGAERGSGSCRASRSPGRRGEGSVSSGGGERARQQQQQQQPGKMVSVPAREKGFAPSPAAASGIR